MAGQATLKLVDMAREGLSLELRTALLAASQGTPTLGRELSVRNNGGFQTVSLSVRPLADMASQGLLLISFQDVAQAPPAAAAPARTDRFEALERDLAYTREILQFTIEEQQYSNEELKSNNEELQSTNEELQSSNEELETSREELQSLNEELFTVNAELQIKIEQLASMQNDMKNLLDNINCGTLFLDQHLRIRRYTRQATSAYRLVSTDVGRPLADIKALLEGDNILEKAQSVLDTLAPWEGELRNAEGIRFLGRIQPYCTLDRVIEGLVLTFTDITQRLHSEAQQAAGELAEAIVNTVRELLVVLDGDLRVITASRSFYSRFQVLPEETQGRCIYDLGNGRWNVPGLRTLLENILPLNHSFEDFAVELDFPVIGRRKLLLNARRMVGKLGCPQLILLTMEEVSI